jgi:hypothetical protein
VQSQKEPGRRGDVTADKNFAGTDKFAVQAIVGPNGKYMETEYTVKVLSP